MNYECADSADWALGYLLVSQTARPPYLLARLLFDGSKELVAAGVSPPIRITIHAKVNGLEMRR